MREEHASSGSKKDFSKEAQCAAEDAVGHSKPWTSKLANLGRQSGKVSERGGEKLLGVPDEILVLERMTEARIPNPADLRTQEVPGEQTTVAAEASVLENELRGLRGC